MTDTMQPTFITLDSAGRIGAVFTGKIVATGLDLTAALGNVTDVNKIRWLRASDSAEVAWIAANVLGTQGGAGADYSGTLELLASAVGAATAADVTLAAISNFDPQVGTQLALVSAPSNVAPQSKHTAVLQCDNDNGIGVSQVILLDGNGNTSFGRCLAQTVLGASAASIDFQGIPAGLDSLVLVCSLRADTLAVRDDVYLRVNNDAGVNYDAELMFAEGAAVTGVDVTGVGDGIYHSLCPGSTAPANAFSSSEHRLPAYSNTATHKAAHGQFSCRKAAGAGGQAVGSIGGTWKSTAAINRLTIYPRTAGRQFVAGSSATLYGFGDRT